MIENSFEFDFDFIVWNIDLGIILQHKISARNNKIDMKMLKEIGKSVHYIKILDELKRIEVLQNNQLLSEISQLMIGRNDILT